MREKKYMVLIDGVVKLAGSMTLEDALMFMKAYCEKYYMQELSLVLAEESSKIMQTNPR